MISKLSRHAAVAREAADRSRAVAGLTSYLAQGRIPAETSNLEAVARVAQSASVWAARAAEYSEAS